MSRRKTLIGTFVASCMAAFMVAPFPAAGAPVGAGKASTKINLVDIKLDSVPGIGSLRAALGIAASEATTENNDPFAHITLDAIRVGDQIVGGQTASSDDPASSKSVSFPLNGGGISGAVSAAEMSATATDDSARAVLSALSGAINIGPLGMGTSIADNGVLSEVTPDHATSRVGATFGPLEVGLGDLLPREAMEALPLSALLELIDGLDIELPVDLAEQVQKIRDLLSTLDELESVVAELDSAQEQLRELTQDDPAVAAVQAVVDSAQAALNDAVSDLAAAQAELAAAQSEVTAAQADVDQANAAVASAQSVMDQKNAALAAAAAAKAATESQLAVCGDPAVCSALQAQLDTINAQIVTLQSEVVAAQQAVAAAQDAVTAAEADLAAANQAVADAQAAIATAQATIDAAQAALDAARADLETAIANVGGDVVQQLLDLIEQIRTQIDSLLETIETLMAQLPDLSVLIDELISLLDGAPLMKIGEIVTFVEAIADSRNGQGSVGCSAGGIEVLGRPVAGGSCEQVAGTLRQVAATVQGVLADLPIGNAVPTVTVGGLDSTTNGSGGPDADGMTSGMARLTALQVQIPSVALSDMVDQAVAEAIATLTETIESLPLEGIGVSEVLGDAIDQVVAQLESLPTGEALSGLRTMGMDAVLGGITSRASFQAVPREQTPGRDPGTDDGDPTTEGSPSGEPQNRAPLPFTGSSTSLVAALALWLVAAGMLLVFAGDRTVRRREHADIQM